ncbi:MAG: YchJ family metal-binding protein [Burkholderiales bacterium]|nr:YchJ family metal-binding protein [Burkholderiales bacterium]
MNKKLLCKCGSGELLLDCCMIFINEDKLPSTPELLMRSRYTAHALGNMQYIAKTMAKKSLEAFDYDEAVKDSKYIKWLKLEVINSQIMGDENGIVEFKAYYRVENKKHLIHEKSRFEMIDNKWFYTDGDIISS